MILKTQKKLTSLKKSPEKGNNKRKKRYKKDRSSTEARTCNSKNCPPGKKGKNE